MTHPVTQRLHGGRRLLGPKPAARPGRDPQDRPQKDKSPASTPGFSSVPPLGIEPRTFGLGEALRQRKYGQEAAGPGLFGWVGDMARDMAVLPRGPRSARDANKHLCCSSK